MDRQRDLPGTPSSRALIRGARDLLYLTAAVALFSALPVLLGWLRVRGWEPVLQDAPKARRNVAEPDPWAARDVDYRSRDARIAARLYLPPGAGPHPALVVAHGSGQSLRGQYEGLGTELASRGWALLTYDKRGVGDSEGTYSGVGPQNSDAMFDLLAADVVAGVDYLAGRADIDAARIGVLGISQGGWIGPLAAQRSRSVSFLVIVSGPAVSVGEENFYSELTGEREDGSRVDSEAELSSRLAAFRGPRGFDPVPVLERLEVPGLWILGAGDRSIPIPETVVRLEALIGAGRPFTLRVLPGVGHGMRNLETGEAVPVSSIATAWLAELEARAVDRR